METMRGKNLHGADVVITSLLAVITGSDVSVLAVIIGSDVSV